MRAAMLLFALVVTACDSDKAGAEATEPSPQKKKAKSSAAPVEASIPKVVVDDKPLALTDAVAFTNGSDSVTVWITDQPIPCVDIVKTPLVRPGENRVRLVFARGYADVPQPWVVRWVSQLEHQGAHSSAPPERGGKWNGVTVGKDKRLTADLDLEAAFHNRTVRVSGKLVARGCGVLTFDTDGKPRPQTKLTSAMGKEQVVLRGARLHGDASKPDKLELSTSALPDQCDTSPYYEEDMRLTIKIFNGQPEPGLVFEGARFRSMTSLTVDWTSGTFELGAPTGDIVPIELDFERGAMKFVGTVDAQVCK